MKKTIILGAVFALSATLSAQKITNQNLLEMKKAGLSEEIIKTKIATEDSHFDVSTQAIVDLKKNGFSDDIISLMIQKNEALKAYSERAETASGVYSIEDKRDFLFINESIKISKGDEIQIYLPASGQDFIFVTQKTGFSTKLLGKVADAVGTGASVVGFGTGSVKVMQGATKVINGANAIRYSTDVLEKIQDLPISNKAKKIAGKRMKITGWKIEEGGYVLNAELEKKKYIINLSEAVMTGEVKLK